MLTGYVSKSLWLSTEKCFKSHSLLVMQFRRLVFQWYVTNRLPVSSFRYDRLALIEFRTRKSYSWRPGALCFGKNIHIHSRYLNSRRPSSFASKRQTAWVGRLPLRLQNDWNHAEFNMYIPRYILIQLSMGAKHLEQQPRPPNNLALNPVKTWGFGEENWWCRIRTKRMRL